MAAIRARTELERRETYIKLLEAHIGSVHPAVALVQLVKQCLQNIPEQRPSTEEVLIRLQGMRSEVEGEYGGSIKVDLVRVRLAMEVKEKDRRIEELQVAICCGYSFGSRIRNYSIGIGGATGPWPPLTPN